MIEKYFFYFIFYSFLGWVWESIYCTIKEKKWADRGFLFGPICPIYGSCATIVSILVDILRHYHIEAAGLAPWKIFLVCMVGSAIAEYGTSWVLEKRFHARWWDYSYMPLNLNGRICLPCSIGFGLAGIVVVRKLIPYVTHISNGAPQLFFDISALLCAMLFGADLALTEASISSLLSDMETYHKEFNERAETTYETVTALPKMMQDKIESGLAGNIATNLANKKKMLPGNGPKAINLPESTEIAQYLKNLSFGQRLTLKSIANFRPDKKTQGHVFRNYLKEISKSKGIFKKK